MIDVGPAQRRGEVEHIGAIVPVEDHCSERLCRSRVAGGAWKVAVASQADRRLPARQAGRADRLERALGGDRRVYVMGALTPDDERAWVGAMARPTIELRPSGVIRCEAANSASLMS